MGLGAFVSVLVFLVPVLSQSKPILVQPGKLPLDSHNLHGLPQTIVVL